MKRLLMFFCLLLAVPSAGLSARNVNLTQLTSLIRQYKHYDDFDSRTFGGLTLAYLRKAVENDTHSDAGTAAAIGLLDGISRIIVCNYETCDDSVKESFSRKVSKSLLSCNILTSKDEEEEKVTVYGNVSSDGTIIRDVVLFSPENCSLVLIDGKVPVDYLSEVIESIAI